MKFGGNNLEKYRKMYFILFHGITDALAEAEKMNFGRMCDILKQAQIDSEEYYITDLQGESPKK